MESINKSPQLMHSIDFLHLLLLMN